MRKAFDDLYGKVLPAFKGASLVTVAEPKAEPKGGLDDEEEDDDWDV